MLVQAAEVHTSCLDRLACDIAAEAAVLALDGQRLLASVERGRGQVSAGFRRAEVHKVVDEGPTSRILHSFGKHIRMCSQRQQLVRIVRRAPCKRWIKAKPRASKAKVMERRLCVRNSRGNKLQWSAAWVNESVLHKKASARAPAKAEGKRICLCPSGLPLDTTAAVVVCRPGHLQLLLLPEGLAAQEHLGRHQSDMRPKHTNHDKHAPEDSAQACPSPSRSTGPVLLLLALTPHITMSPALSDGMAGAGTVGASPVYASSKSPSSPSES